MEDRLTSRLPPEPLLSIRPSACSCCGCELLGASVRCVDCDAELCCDLCFARHRRLRHPWYKTPWAKNWLGELKILGILALIGVLGLILLRADKILKWLSGL